MKRFALILLFLPFLFACTTLLPEIPEDLDSTEYFQLAQSAIIEKKDYTLALHYYQSFINRKPDEVRRIVEAEYEMALIYYKMDEFEIAETLFNRVVNKYNQAGAEVLPPWPLVLSLKYIDLLAIPEE